MDNIKVAEELLAIAKELGRTAGADKMFFVKGSDGNYTLWVSYGKSSGTTEFMNKIPSYVSDRQGKNYAGSILRKAEGLLKPNKVTELGIYNNADEPYDNVKPISKLYAVYVPGEKVNLIDFFKSKGEALSWIRHSN